MTTTKKLLEIARQYNIHKTQIAAAAALGIHQSEVARGLKKLDDLVGFNVFIRNPNKKSYITPELTQKGRELLEK